MRLRGLIIYLSILLCCCHTEKENIDKNNSKLSSLQNNNKTGSQALDHTDSQKPTIIINQKGDTIKTGFPHQLGPENFSKIPFTIDSRMASNPKLSCLSTSQMSLADSLPMLNFAIHPAIIDELESITFALNTDTLKIDYPQPMATTLPIRREDYQKDISVVGKQQGLKSLLVWDAVEDENGNVWIVTEGGGLSKYNGEYIQTFTKQHGLTTDVLLDICLDPNGHIWFGGWGGHLTKYDGQNFIAYKITDDKQLPHVQSVLFEKNGTIWISTFNLGIFKLEGDNITQYKSAPKVGRVSGGLAEDNAGNIWLRAEKGLVKIEDRNLVIYIADEEIQQYEFNPGMIDNDGNLWGFVTDVGIFKHDGTDFQLITKNEGLLSTRFMNIMVDSKNTIWIATQEGLQSLNNNIFTTYTKESGLPINDVYGIYEGSENTYWLSQSGGGLTQLKLSGLENFTINNGLPAEQLSSIGFLDNGSISMGFWGNGFAISKGGEFNHFSIDNGLRNPYTLKSFASNDKVYIQDTQGLGYFDGQNFNYYNIEEGQYITHYFHKAQNGEIWLGTRRFGVLTIKDDHFRRLQLPGFENIGMTPVFEDRARNVWIGLNKNLAKLKDDMVTYYGPKEGFAPEQRIDIIKEDKQGNIWIVEHFGGLIKYDGADFKRILKPDLSLDGDLHLVFDASGNGWLMTPFSLIFFETDSDVEKVYRLTNNNGLKNFELSWIDINKQNQLYIVGRDGGLDIIDLNTFKISERIPQPIFTDITINGEYKDFRSQEFIKKGHTDTGVELFTNIPKNLVLEPKNNHVTFSFTATDWTAPEEIEYSYRLDPLEDEWSLPSNESKIDYRNLPYGDLSFYVKARGQNDTWSEAAVFNFKVNHPWWQTNQAYLIYALLLGLFIYSISSIRTRSYKKRQLQLEHEIRIATKEVVKQKEKAEQSEKYKEQFLANMSHEIRTPMNAISGMLKILKRKPHPKHQDEYLNAMDKSSEHLLVLLNDILDLSKIEAGKIEIDKTTLSLSQIFNYIEVLFGFKAKSKGLILETKIDENLPQHVVGDPNRLTQILVNLVGNAIKFSYSGTIVLDVRKKNEVMRFSVSDEGIGISKDDLPNIFKSFTQSDRRKDKNEGGTGLGLSISKRLIELQDGKIWIDTEKSHGSTFYFELPLIAASQRCVDTLYDDAELKTMGEELIGLKVLLAEDNEFNIMVAQDELEWFIPEVNISLSYDGEEAFKLWQKTNFDLIITDIQMPLIDGYQLTRRIREIESADPEKDKTPIIAMTASVLKKDLDKCKNAGMDGYIPKPYSSNEFIPSIHKVLKNKHKNWI